MTDQPTYPDVTVKLIGEDGNAALIIGRVAKVLRREVSAEAANRFADEAFDLSSYDDVLRLVMKTVNVI